jgi:hypothetical protein
MDAETQGVEYGQIPPEIATAVAHNCEASSPAAVVEKAFSDRTSTATVLTSDADEEMMMVFTFRSVVSIKAFMVVGASDGDEGSAPSSLRVFVNAVDTICDFDTASSATPTQTWTLDSDNADGTRELPTNITKLAKVTSLVVHIPGNLDDTEQTMLAFFGMRGVAGAEIKANIVKTKYESRAQLSDHASDQLQVHGRVAM